MFRVSHEERVIARYVGWEGPHAGRWGTGRKGILKGEVRGADSARHWLWGIPPHPSLSIIGSRTANLTRCR